MVGAFMLTSKACYAAFHDLEELVGRMLRASFLTKQLENLPGVMEDAATLFMRDGILRMSYQRLIFFAAPGSKKCPSLSIYTNKDDTAHIISTELLKSHQKCYSDREGDLYAVTIEPMVLRGPPVVVFAEGERGSSYFSTNIEDDVYCIAGCGGGGRGYTLPTCIHDVLAPDAIRDK